MKNPIFCIFQRLNKVVNQKDLNLILCQSAYNNLNLIEILYKLILFSNYNYNYKYKYSLKNYIFYLI